MSRKDVYFAQLFESKIDQSEWQKSRYTHTPFKKHALILIQRRGKQFGLDGCSYAPRMVSALLKTVLRSRAGVFVLIYSGKPVNR